MNFDFDKHIRKLVTGDVIFWFKKELSVNQITEDLLNIDEALNTYNMDTKIRKRIFYISVELIQNLYHHKMYDIDETVDGIAKFSWFFILKIKDNYGIVTGNFMKTDNIDKIKNHLDVINKTTPEELKALYKSILTNEKFSEKGGGGLGMIDIARKANGIFTYNFIPYRNNLTFFELQIPINNNSF